MSHRQTADVGRCESFDGWTDTSPNYALPPCQTTCRSVLLSYVDYVDLDEVMHVVATWRIQVKTDGILGDNPTLTYLRAGRVGP